MQFLPIAGLFGDPSSQSGPTHDPYPAGLEETANDIDGYVKYDRLLASRSSGGGATEISTLLHVIY